jgi:hypothetical protein
MMPYAVLGLFILFLIVTYIVVQGTRAALAWRQAAAEGDTDVIRTIVSDAISVWSSQKRPKPVAAEVWRGIQSMQLLDVHPTFVRVSCLAESEYKMQDGRWIEIRNPLQEGFAITAKAADMLFYELPHYQPESVQVDVYATYRSDDGATRRECVLSTAVTREQAKAVDWEEWTAEEIVAAFDPHYRLSDTGRPLAIEPLTPPPLPESPSQDGAPAEAFS